MENVIINDIQYHTNDKGKHLFPCVEENCDGLSFKPKRSSTVVKIAKHQVEQIHDPLAKQSHRHRHCHRHCHQHRHQNAINVKEKMKNNFNFNCKNKNNATVIDQSGGDGGGREGDGDGDVWVEVLYEHVKTGEIKSYFKSTKDPNRKVPEPPTGASHVIFLKSSYIEKHTK